MVDSAGLMSTAEEGALITPFSTITACDPPCVAALRHHAHARRNLAREPTVFVDDGQVNKIKPRVIGGRIADVHAADIKPAHGF